MPAARNVRILELKDDREPLPPDLVPNLVDFLNGSQPGIKFSRHEDRIRSSTGNNPFASHNLRKHDRDLNPDRIFTVYVSKSIISEGPFLERGGDGYFTLLGSLEKRHDIPSHIFGANMVSKAVAYYNVQSLSTIKHAEGCPLSPHKTMKELRATLSNESYCEICSQAIESLVLQGELGENWPASISAIIESNAAVYARYVDKRLEQEDGYADEDGGITFEAGNREEKSSDDEGSSKISHAVVLEKQITTVNLRSTALPDSEEDQDCLDFHLYADAIAEMISNPETKTPLNIAICGNWGRGKSFLLDRIQKKVTDKSKRDNKPPPTFVNFNAWEHSLSGEVWPRLFDKVARELNEDVPKEFGWRHLKKSFPKLINNLTAPVIVLVILMAIMSLKFSHLHISFESLVNLDLPFWFLTIVGPILLTFVVFASSYARRWFRFFLSGYDIAYFINHLAASNDQNFNLNILHEIIDKKINERCYVIIEDLDRCSDEQIIHVLQSIQLNLRLDKVVFLVSMDMRALCHPIIRLKNPSLYDSRDQEAILRGGIHYLEKIMTVSFSIPQANKEQIVLHLDTLLASHIGNLIIRPEPAKVRMTASDPQVLVGGEDPSRTSKQSEVHDTSKADKSTTEQTIRPTLNDQEVELLKKVVRVKSSYFSPRLLKRFTNAYFLARILYREQNRSDFHSPSHLRAFISWLAVTILYPVDAPTFLEIFENESEIEGYSYLAKLRILISQANGGEENSPKPTSVTMSNLESIAKLLEELRVELSLIGRTTFITDCFNIASK